LRSEAAILCKVLCLMGRPWRADEIVAALTPDATARSSAVQPRRASSRSRLTRFNRELMDLPPLMWRRTLHHPCRLRPWQVT
jgi:hypothetical protein